MEKETRDVKKKEIAAPDVIEKNAVRVVP